MILWVCGVLGLAWLVRFILDKVSWVGGVDVAGVVLFGWG